MPNSLPSINLVKNKQTHLFDKILNWTLTIGRLIVIVTEVIAVFAFVYRFSLDDKLVNLHSEIKQQQNIVFALKSDESKYRNLQERIALASAFSAKGIKTNQSLSTITNLISNQAKINNLTLNKDRVNLDINVASVTSLADFIDSLKGYHDIKSISIDNIENKPAIGLSAEITVGLK